MSDALWRQPEGYDLVLAPPEAEIRRLLAQLPPPPRRLRLSFWGAQELLRSGFGLGFVLFLALCFASRASTRFLLLTPLALLVVPLAICWIKARRQRRTLQYGAATVAVVTESKEPGVTTGNLMAARYMLRGLDGRWQGYRWCQYRQGVPAAVGSVAMVFFDPDDDSRHLVENAAFFTVRREDQP